MVRTTPSAPGKIHRHYYELCLLYELRNALRSGDIWLETSRRYANPETYLILKDRWQAHKNEVRHQISAPQEAHWRLTERQTELEELLEQVDTMLEEEYSSTGHSDAEGVRLQSGESHRDGRVRIENG